MEIVNIAREHNLIIFADEIYDKILYDDAEHHSIAALAPNLLTRPRSVAIKALVNLFCRAVDCMNSVTAPGS